MIFQKKLINTELKYDSDEEKLYRFNKCTKKWTKINPATHYDKSYKKEVFYRVKIDKKMFLIHRLIYHICNDDFDIYNPKIQIDHINHNPNDNRLENLRTCTHRQNNQNRKTMNGKEVKGFAVRKNGKFQAYYQDINGKTKFKNFKTEIEARNYYLQNTIRF